MLTLLTVNDFVSLVEPETSQDFLCRKKSQSSADQKERADQREFTWSPFIQISHLTHSVNTCHVPPPSVEETTLAGRNMVRVERIDDQRNHIAAIKLRAMPPC